MSCSYRTKLAIGTVQFGLDYGISNSSGKTTLEQVRKILEVARRYGVSYLDTAHLYGDSEDVIGRVNISRDFSVVTKTPYFNNDLISDVDAKKLELVFRESCEKLGQSPYGLLIHNGNDLLKPGGEKLFDVLQKIKSERLVKKIGVSVYSPAQCKSIFDIFGLDLVQLPLSIYDQRFINTGMVDFLRMKNTEIHARSVFLQGLLLMQDLPEKFKKLHKLHNKFHNLCGNIGRTALEIALMFVVNMDQIDKVVVGVNTADQLLQILEVRDTDVSGISLAEFAVDDENIVDPSKWA